MGKFNETKSRLIPAKYPTVQRLAAVLLTFSFSFFSSSFLLSSYEAIVLLCLVLHLNYMLLILIQF